jgi:anti-sigma B factor antagonist
MKITTDLRDAQGALMRLEGRFDADTADAFKQAVKDLATRGVQHVTVDMAQVTFLDSSGLSALVAALKVLRQAGGGVNLAAVGPQAKTALRLTLLDKVLPIYETVEEAARHFRR